MNGAVGSNALLTAVENNASVEVIEAIIRVNPYALCNNKENGNEIDPLTLAKRYRPNETELIELLELPISYWLDPVQRSMSSNPVSHSQPNHLKHQVGGFLDNETKFYKLSNTEREELDNIKVITTSLLRSQRRQAESDAQERADIISRLDELKINEKLARQDQLAIFKQREKSMIKTHFVALDMKERALRQKLVSVGNNIKGSLKVNEEAQEGRHKALEESLASLRAEISDATDKIQQLSDDTEAKLNSISNRVDREGSLNSKFRERTVLKQLQLEQKFENITKQGRNSLFVDRIDHVQDFFSDQRKQNDHLLKGSMIQIAPTSSVLDDDDKSSDESEDDSTPLVKDESRGRRCFKFLSFHRVLRKRRRWQVKEDGKVKLGYQYRPFKRRKKSNSYSKMKCLRDPKT